VAFLIAYDARKPHPFTERDHKFGSASFLCPVCAVPLFGEDGVSDDPCPHVLLVFNLSGAVRCRDDIIEGLVREATDAARESGADPMERLRTRLGSNVVFFELMDQPPGSTQGDVFTFVIDLTSTS